MAEHPSLREQLALARKKRRDAKQKKADTKPHSDRRKKLTRIKLFLDDRIDRLKARLDKRRHHVLSIRLTPGAPHWGGCQDILEQRLDRYVQRQGISKTSGKRSASDPLSIANPGSDHSAAQMYASASDYGTAENYTLRNELCRLLGIEAVIYDYGAYYFYVNGTRFRLQPIAEQHGTGPHLHMGLRRA